MYIVVGGCPVTVYTGTTTTTTFTGLKLLGQFKTKEEANKFITSKLYDECDGLIQVFKIDPNLQG